MIKYENICDYNKAQRRLAKNHYGHFWDDHTREGDQLQMFTLSKSAEQDSQENLHYLLNLCHSADIQYLVLGPNEVQFLGPNSATAAAVAWTPAWMSQYKLWAEDSGCRQVHARTEVSACSSIYFTRLCVCVKQQNGVYDVATARKITNRRAIIENFWQHGFATRRGRPPSVARPKDTGTRQEIQELTELADKYWQQGVSQTTEITRRYIATYRYLNKYHAWPGAW